MKKNKLFDTIAQEELGKSLEDIIREGARSLIHIAIEAELSEMLAAFAQTKTITGQKVVVRNGYLPSRHIVTGIGSVEVRVPKVRDRSGTGIKFNSRLVPPFVRRAKSISAALPWLYLKGISTGQMKGALTVLLGEGVKGINPNTVSRLKADWADEYTEWMRRDLKGCHYVYWWADAIQTSVREIEDNRQCLLVIIGVTREGKKELVTIGDGFRESSQSWVDVLRDLKTRGLERGPFLATGDGALGFWAAIDEVYPETRHQRFPCRTLGSFKDNQPD